MGGGIVQFIEQKTVMVFFDAEDDGIGPMRITGCVYAKQFVVLLQLVKNGDNFPAAGDFVMRRVAIPL